MTTGKEKILLTHEEAVRISRVARATADRLICQETLRLALPIVRLSHEMIIAAYKRIKKNYGGVK